LAMDSWLLAGLGVVINKAARRWGPAWHNPVGEKATSTPGALSSHGGLRQ
jgi:hypothetical protein